MKSVQTRSQFDSTPINLGCLVLGTMLGTVGKKIRNLQLAKVGDKSGGVWWLNKNTYNYTSSRKNKS